MARFDPAYPLAGLRGASYNPRRIHSDAMAALQESLAALGVCKPIIVSGDLIVAGHQRTQAMRALGRNTAPAIVLDGVTEEDEIRFNQLHNGTDFDSGDEAANVGPAGCEPMAFEMAPAAQITGNLRARLCNVRLAICELLRKYGNWGGAVATMSGDVIHAAQYVLACKAIAIPARVYRIPDAMRAEAARMLGRQYGVFSYAHLERKTYIQTFAQMMRLRDGVKGAGASAKSSLYETRILPDLRPNERVLDFGCGQGDYVAKLQAVGRPIVGVEFFFRAGHMIDGRAVHRQIDALAADLARHGRFDVVLADSVLNSVDSLQAEADVATCLNAFCRPGGRIYFSGRKFERLAAQDGFTHASRNQRYVDFPDEHGFTALFRNGNWFYQKFHTREQATGLGRMVIGPDATYASKSSTSWTCGGVKSVEMDAADQAAAIAREFDLIWPGGKTVGRADQILTAWRSALVLESP